MANDSVLKIRPSKQSIFDRAWAQVREDGGTMFWTVMVEKNGKVEKAGTAIENDFGQILFETTVPAGARIMLVHDRARRG
jgi:hypothetical protein